jgi:hypothetical protein
MVAEAAIEGGATPRANARPLAVISIAFGLALLVAAIAALVRPSVREIDAEAELGRLFEPVTWPLALVVDHASQLPAGEHVVVLVDPGAPPEAQAPAAEEAKPAEPGATPEHYDASKVVVGPPGPAPRRVVLLSDPARPGLELPRGSATRPSASDVKHLGAAGGIVPIELGRMHWREYDADFVHERDYERGGTFKDSLRVNLSANGRSCLLLAEWTRGTAGSRAQIETLIAALVPRAKADAGSGAR